MSVLSFFPAGKFKRILAIWRDSPLNWRGNPSDHSQSPFALPSVECEITATSRASWHTDQAICWPVETAAMVCALENVSQAINQKALWTQQNTQWWASLSTCTSSQPQTWYRPTCPYSHSYQSGCLVSPFSNDLIHLLSSEWFVRTREYKPIWNEQSGGLGYWV